MKSSFTLTSSSCLLVNPVFPAVTDSWFCPEWWSAKAEPVTAGGRGSAWFLTSAYGDLVLRRYKRGGLVARLSERTYIYTGFRRARSLAEFRLLRILASRGLPVPTAVAAFAQKHGLLWYRAAILVSRLPGAVPLPESPQLDHPELWQKLGRLVRRFHDEGLDHVDLNMDNVLVAEDKLYLIDFDRCQLRDGSSTTARWKRRNLDRLLRSVRKRCQALPAESRAKLWDELLQGYHGSSL